MTCHSCQVKLFDFTGILVVHHVIADIHFCDTCHEECGVDWRRKLFHCDRQVTVKLHGGVPRSS